MADAGTYYTIFSSCRWATPAAMSAAILAPLPAIICQNHAPSCQAALTQHCCVAQVAFLMDAWISQNLTFDTTTAQH